jgi:predicted secreted protein
VETTNSLNIDQWTARDQVVITCNDWRHLTRIARTSHRQQRVGGSCSHMAAKHRAAATDQVVTNDTVHQDHGI